MSINKNSIGTNGFDGMRRIAEDIQKGVSKAIVEMLKYYDEHGEWPKTPEKTEEENLRDRLKLGKITLNGKSGYITYIDNKTEEAYVVEGQWYTNSWKLKEPLEKETRPYTFERWCTGFDM